MTELVLRALIGAGLGLIIGSFLASASLRWPEGRSVARGRSSCESCGAVLRPVELVPLLSFAFQRGKCRHCGTPIGLRHPAIELAAALVGGAAMAAHAGWLGPVSALFGWWLLLIAILDLEHQWLPDFLTLPLIPLGLAAAWAGFGPSLTERAAGAVAGWGALWLIALLYRRLRGREGMGGGDPPLLGAIGAWVGALQLPFVLLGAGMAGFTALLLMRVRGQPIEAATKLPLGTMMALAAWPIWLVLPLT